MQFSPPFIRRLHGVRYYIGIGAIGGLVLGAGIELTLSSGQPYNVVLSSLRGMLTGAMVAGLISAFEFFFAQSPQGRGFRRLSFGTMILWRVVYYSSVVLLCDFVGSHFSTRPWGFNRPTMIVFAVALAFSFAVNLLAQISMLLGPGVLGSFVRGRYYAPRREERLFLFVDMRGSTAAAERLGDVAFHRYLNDFISDIGEVVHEHGGTIHKYIGDEVVATWPLGDPRLVAGAFSAVRGSKTTLAARAQHYQAAYGSVPEFRAVLHAGPIVAGEMGDIKREIALIGNTINTTAKIEAAAKQLPHDVVVTDAALAAAAPLPAGFAAQPLGPTDIPGKAEPLNLHAIKIAE